MPTQPILQLGRYLGFEELAQGGMGVVVLGRMKGPVGFSRTVAIKRIHSQFAQERAFVRAFVDEARLAARIQHPNVISTLDVVTQDGTVYLVMEFVLGDSLRPIVELLAQRDQRMPRAVALGVMSQVLQGLHAAHEATDERGAPLNLIHRDVTPHNVLLGVDGVARLIDFGVAKANNRLQITDENQVKGKVGYVTPEHILGQPLDRRADVYSASVVLWELLTGKRLFEPSANTSFLVTQGAIRRPSKLVSNLAGPIEDIVMKGLSLSPVDRFSTAKEMAMAIERTEAIATPMQIGDWLTGLGMEAIERRRRRVAEVESAQFREAAEVNRSVSNLMALSPPSYSDAHDLSAYHTPAMPQDDAPALSQDRGPAPRSRARVALLVGAAAIVAVLAVGAFAVSRTRATPPLAPSAATSAPSATVDVTPALPTLAPVPVASSSPVASASASASGSGSAKPAPRTPKVPKKKRFVDDGF